MIQELEWIEDLEKTGNTKKKWFNQALLISNPMIFSDPSGKLSKVMLITNLGTYMGGPFIKKELDYDGKVVVTTLDNIPVCVNKNNISKWAPSKNISTD